MKFYKYHPTREPNKIYYIVSGPDELVRQARVTVVKVINGLFYNVNDTYFAHTLAQFTELTPFEKIKYL